MKALTLLAVILLESLTFPSVSFAKDLVFGTPIYSGSGCPVGSAAVSVSPDGKKTSVLFDQFTVRNSRKNCGFAVPVTVPAGFQISLFTIDYRGYVAPNTKGRLSTDYFFAGQKTRSTVKVIDGEKDYSLRDDVRAVTWSACGAEDNMRLNLAASGAGDATVDSTDIASYGLLYIFNFKPC